MPVDPRMLVEWKSQYDIGIPEIDEQHAKIVRLINAVHAAVTTRSRKPNFIAQVISELENYVAEHFSCEESLMKAVGYPGLAEQRKQHAVFVDRVYELKEQFKTSFIDLKQVLRFIADWFVEHTQRSDRRFAEWKAASGK